MSLVKATATVWVFNGSGGSFPSGVFSGREKAEDWIRLHKLSGTLTEYPLDMGVYDWAIENGFFTPRKDHQLKADFIGTFSSASQKHDHYVNGENHGRE